MRNKIISYVIVLVVGLAGGGLLFNLFSPDGTAQPGTDSKTYSDNIPAENELIPARTGENHWRPGIDEDRRNAIVRAAERVSPAVVSITATQERVMRRRSIIDDFYSEFWGWYLPPRKYIRKTQSMGSGVIIDPEGVILTNAHVVQDATEIRVVTPAGEEYTAELVGLDNTIDIAVLRIDGNKLPFAELGDSENMMIGEWAIAFGNPFGHLMEDTEPSVTAGVISALHRDIKRDPNQVQIFKDMIQTDAAINPGNSGGPLCNAVGEVIGINTFIFTSSRGSEGIGFAIPINKIKIILDDLLKFGEVIKAWTGMYVQKITPILAQSMDLPVTRGVIVTDIEEDGPADKAGVKRGDILIRAGDEKVLDGVDWEEIESIARPGNPIDLTILRRGKEMNLKLTPVESMSATANAVKDKFGIYVMDITPAIARQLRTDKTAGVVITKIDPAGRAASWDIEPGDIIRQIGRLNIADTEGYFKILENIDKGDKFTFILERNNMLYYLTVRY
ncbi:MAG: PDZ domain-containing protein [candidate division Zixibacteria bacterium]|nr:PDZ domain-containing protein [candidate division Zixibacteria bacterium]